MNVSAWSIRNPIPAILLFALLTVVGIISFRSMGIQDFPDIELPVVTVSASLEGAAPAQLETDIARRLENSVATLGGVKHIYTTITEGAVTMNVEFNLEKGAAEAVNDVRDAISRIRADLPGDMRDPVISKVTTSGRAILTYTVASSRLDEEALSWFVDNSVAKTLLAVPGVGKVSRVGGVDREVRVTLDPEQLAALNVSAADISRQLKRVQQEAPGGRGDVSGAQQSVRTIATVHSAAQLAALDIPLGDGRSVRLDQVAQVADTVSERTALALLDGKPVVGFEITRSKGASEVAVARDVRVAIAQLARQQPQLKFVEAFDSVAPVQDSYDGSMDLLYEGALLAIAVVLWFLKSWRATLVAATALPLSIIPTFIVMHYLGFSLNTVTLLALALVAGILVDDAIVEIENIVRHLRMGKSPFQAALEAADEIGLAVIATTFTLVAVFLPTAFMSGIPGKFFKQFGLTAAIAVLASLLVARLLTPMMAAYLLEPMPQKTRPGWLMTHYLRWMQACLQHRYLTALAAALFFAGSIALIPLLPTGFVPPADRSQTFVNIDLPPGSTLADTRAIAGQARHIIIHQVKDVTLVYTSIGGGSGGGDLFSQGASRSARKATLSLRLTHRTERARSQQAIEAELRNQLQILPGARVTVGGGDSGEKMQLVLSGEDPAALATASHNVERELRGIRGLGNITSSASLLRPEIIVKPDFARAADLGVTAANIGDTLRIATSGDYSTGLAKLNLAERQIPIRVRLPDSTRADLDALARLSVPGKNGDIMLGSVASLALDSGPAQIDRFDRNRNITINLELNGRQLGEVLKEANQLPSLKTLPPGVHRAEVGDAREMQELFGSFGLAMLIGVLCVYLILVLLFRDFVQPVTILAAIPLAFGGAFAALYLTHSSFSMPSLIGLLMLMGIVTKNSILLVEYTIVARRDHGMSRFDALTDACRKRAQPILMTSIAMAAGMLPIALGIGADPSFRAPMAIAVIGGIITSTLLSLLIIPVVFTFVDDAFNLIKAWARPRQNN